MSFHDLENAINRIEIKHTGLFFSLLLKGNGLYSGMANSIKFWHSFSRGIKKQIMKKKSTEEDIKTDLKHDSMEFAATTDGDDILDTDDDTYEEEGINAEELDALEDDPDNEAAALNATETDLQADEDIMPEEDWTDDLPDMDAEDDDEDDEYQRK